jgi:hypothetical protein
MYTKGFITIIIFALLLTSIGCELINSEDDDEAKVVRRDGKIFIEDRTGKSWDVTHAVNNYGFIPEQFQFGLGPFAIRPILNPKMLERGEFGYPGVDDERLIIGTTINGDTRAYPLNVLNNHEVVDEQFDSTYVAVAY